MIVAKLAIAHFLVARQQFAAFLLALLMLQHVTAYFLPRIARTIVSVAIAASVFGLIASSIGLLTAFGNEERYGNAKKDGFAGILSIKRDHFEQNEK